MLCKIEFLFLNNKTSAIEKNRRAVWIGISLKPKVLCSVGIIKIQDIIAISEIKTIDIKSRLVKYLMFLYLNLNPKKLNPIHKEHKAVIGDIFPRFMVSINNMFILNSTKSKCCKSVNEPIRMEITANKR